MLPKQCCCDLWPNHQKKKPDYIILNHIFGYVMPKLMSEKEGTV
jgi:hypothetical protein